MSFTPMQTDQMSVWEFNAALDGWKMANGHSEPTYPTEDEFDQAVRNAR